MVIKVFLTKKAYDTVLKPSKHEKIIFLSYFVEAIFLKNVTSRGFRKKYIKEGWPFRGAVYRKGIQTLCTLCKINARGVFRSKSNI